MKNKTTLSIGLAMGVILLSLFGLSSNAHAQAGDSVGDTGLVTLGPTEFLRITVTPKNRESSAASVSEIVVAGTGYGAPACSADKRVCTRDVLFDYQGSCDLLRGKACSFDMDLSFQALAASGIQAQIFASRPNRIVVTALVIDRVTQKTGHVTISR